MKHLTYGELKEAMIEHNRKFGLKEKPLVGVIVFTEHSFKQAYPLLARSYRVNSHNKAFIDGMSGYSIFGSSLDGTDIYVRLEQYMSDERGGMNGWYVDYCYIEGDEHE